MSLSKWRKISIGGSPANGRAVAARPKEATPFPWPSTRAIHPPMEPTGRGPVNHSAAIPFICQRTDGQEAPLDLSIDAEKKPTSCLLRLLLCWSAVSSGGPLGGPDPPGWGRRGSPAPISIEEPLSRRCVAAFLDCDGWWRARTACEGGSSATRRPRSESKTRTPTPHPGRRIGRRGSRDAAPTNQRPADQGRSKRAEGWPQRCRGGCRSRSKVLPSVSGAWKRPTQLDHYPSLGLVVDDAQ